MTRPDQYTPRRVFVTPSRVKQGDGAAAAEKELTSSHPLGGARSSETIGTEVHKPQGASATFNRTWTSTT